MSRPARASASSSPEELLLQHVIFRKSHPKSFAGILRKILEKGGERRESRLRRIVYHGLIGSYEREEKGGTPRPSCAEAEGLLGHERVRRFADLCAVRPLLVFLCLHSYAEWILRRHLPWARELLLETFPELDRREELKTQVLRALLGGSPADADVTRALNAQGNLEFPPTASYGVLSVPLGAWVAAQQTEALEERYGISPPPAFAGDVLVCRHCLAVQGSLLSHRFGFNKVVYDANLGRFFCSKARSRGGVLVPCQERAMICVNLVGEVLLVGGKGGAPPVAYALCCLCATLCRPSTGDHFGGLYPVCGDCERKALSESQAECCLVCDGRRKGGRVIFIFRERRLRRVYLCLTHVKFYPLGRYIYLEEEALTRYQSQQHASHQHQQHQHKQRTR